MARVRIPMSPAVRAKQFAPFDALDGLQRALLEKRLALVREERRNLAEDREEELNFTLLSLLPGEIVTAAYYCDGAYVTKTGAVTRLDLQEGVLIIDTVEIPFDILYDIETGNVHEA